jgi:hypothetical protein
MLHVKQKTSPSIMLASPTLDRATFRASSALPPQPAPVGLGTAFRWRMGEKLSVERLQKVGLAQRGES